MGYMLDIKEDRLTLGYMMDVGEGRMMVMGYYMVDVREGRPTMVYTVYIRQGILMMGYMVEGRTTLFRMKGNLNLICWE